ncbi:MAG: hypothetical protein KJ793_05100 [Candidatus Omnitrophica bacterium]|nr:hypothetical protein [Candidatus Omnitrophota bacterium]
MEKRARSVKSTLDNLKTLCCECNLGKGNAVKGIRCQ